MATKIRVRNYQSIEDATLTAAGLTAITGANNSGKSAMLRAVRGVFSNARNSRAFVRHGTPNADVTIEFEDGQLVRWEKGEGVNRYTVNGKVLDKVGNGVPPEVSDLGVAAVKVGDLPLWPQIAQQFTGQVFLVDQPGSVVAEAISDVERVGKLNSALKASEQDRRAVQAKLKTRKSDLEEAERGAGRYQNLDIPLGLVDALGPSYEDAQRKARGLRILVGLKVRLDTSRTEVGRLAGVERISGTSDATVEGIRQVRASLVEARRLAAQTATCRATVAALAPVETLTAPDTAAAVSLKTNLEVVRGLAARLASAAATVEAAIQAASATDSVRVAEPPPSDLKDAAKEARRLKERLECFRQEIFSIEESLTAKEASLQDTQQEIDGMLGSLGSCPTCGQGVGHGGCA